MPREIFLTPRALQHFTIFTLAKRDLNVCFSLSLSLQRSTPHLLSSGYFSNSTTIILFRINDHSSKSIGKLGNMTIGVLTSREILISLAALVGRRGGLISLWSWWFGLVMTVRGQISANLWSKKIGFRLAIWGFRDGQTEVAKMRCFWLPVQKLGV